MNDNINNHNDDEMLIETVTFEDDEGNTFSMEIVDEFEHKGLQYAVLTDFDEEHEHGEECGCEHGEDCSCSDEEQNLYIFQVVKTDDGEEDFLPVEDDSLLEELSSVVEGLLLLEE